jgi:hypothetical protein
MSRERVSHSQRVSSYGQLKVTEKDGGYKRNEIKLSRTLDFDS